MKPEHPSSENYFFVSFGIDKGGYLDILNLPVNPTMAEAKKAELDYKKDIEREIKSERKSLKEKLGKREISQEEFDSKCKELENVENAKQSHLNKLKEKFSAEISKKRDLQNRGLKDEDVSWLPMIKPIADLKSLALLITTPAPMRKSERGLSEKFPVMDPSNIKQLILSLKSEDNGNTIEGAIHNLMEVIHVLHLSVYHQNDLLWNNLMKSFFMDCWSGQIATWIKELELLYNSMDYRVENKTSSSMNSNHYDRSLVLFPALIQSFTIQIDELKEQELNDIMKTPERSGDVKFSEQQIQLLKRLFGMQNLNTSEAKI